MNRTVFIFVLICAVIQNIYSQTQVTLQEGSNGYAGTTDTTIFRDASSNALGGTVAILAGATGSSDRRGLLRFDLSSIPQNAEVTNAVLTLRVDAQGSAAQASDVFRIHPLLKDWGEGTAIAGQSNGSGSGFGAAAGAGDATWQSNHHTQSTWTTAGGDFDAGSSAEAQIASQTLVFQSTAVAAAVQQWVRDAASNFGWIIIGNESGARNARRFTSSEGAQARRPQLQVTYQVPVSVSDWDVY